MNIELTEEERVFLLGLCIRAEVTWKFQIFPDSEKMMKRLDSMIDKLQAIKENLSTELSGISG